MAATMLGRKARGGIEGDRFLVLSEQLGYVSQETAKDRVFKAVARAATGQNLLARNLATKPPKPSGLGGDQYPVPRRLF